MNRRTFVLVALAAYLPGYAAQADFKLQAAVPGAASAIVSSPTDSSAPAAKDIPELALPNKPRVPYARGFGRAVPLSFAARQIVPRNVAIRFGVDVDQSLPVDWSGGRPWNLVMDAAVKPLHLHLTFSRTSVLIS